MRLAYACSNMTVYYTNDITVITNMQRCTENAFQNCSSLSR